MGLFELGVITSILKSGSTERRKKIGKSEEKITVNQYVAIANWLGIDESEQAVLFQSVMGRVQEVPGPATRCCNSKMTTIAKGT